MAGKLLFMRFVPSDWMRDSRVRDLSDATKAIWIDLLCVLFDEAPDSGRSARTLARWARNLGRDEATVLAALRELQEVGTADVAPALAAATSSTVITVKSRRMARDAVKREAKRGRQRRWRRGGDGHGDADLDARGTEKRQAEAPEAPEKDQPRLPAARKLPVRAREASGASLIRTPEPGRPMAWPPIQRPAAARPLRAAASLGDLLADVVAPLRRAPPLRAVPDRPPPPLAPRPSSAARAGRPARPFEIRDPVALAVHAQRRGAVAPGRAGLLRALWAAVHAIREGLKPAALFWHLLRQPAMTWCRSRDDDEAAALLRTVRFA